ncbi:MAG: transposase [Anaerolineaceae bacterium]
MTVADPSDDDLVEARTRACPSTAPNASQSVPSKTGQPQGVDPTEVHLSLPEIVHRLKSLTTHRYIEGVKNNDWPRFDTRLWQRNYYEHIIRNEEELQAVYEYILANPMTWETDEENLSR